MIIRVIAFLCASLALLFSTFSVAQPSFLSADQAFEFSAQSISDQQAELSWKIAPHYYLYHDQFKVSVKQQPLKLNLPQGQEKNDPTFGKTWVHYDQVRINLDVTPNTRYQVAWQGCSADGLCYPLQRATLETDATGLLPQFNATQHPLLQHQPSNTRLLNASSSATPSTTVLEPDASTLTPHNDVEKSASLNTEKIPSQTPTAFESLNNDQTFLHFLSQDHAILNLGVFFVLGILLAFLPCSLPLIPILSGIIIQRAKGYKAVAIALSFVVSMAAVYALMGIVVAEIGYSFQRWFQSPIIISIFSFLFFALALNLFGLYQLNLPQKLTQKLHHLQNQQKTGTILGASMMGMLSALIVGPCMSAPLAGALLFVSQSQNALWGGIYLFVLGLGIGLPLFVASVFGARLLPKPGIWMDRLKVCFGFLMLMMAVYFIRPMLPTIGYFALIALICSGFALYLFTLLRHQTTTLQRGFTLLFALLALYASYWNIQQSFQTVQIQQHEQSRLKWQKVTTLEELEQALTAAKQQQKPIILDVYADWCVACQPIEREVFPRQDVQTALHDFYRIQLDLSQYHASQDQILKQHEILGPPTLLFLQPSGQEYRDLRLTGTFSAKQLLQHMQNVQSH